MSPSTTNSQISQFPGLSSLPSIFQSPQLLGFGMLIIFLLLIGTTGRRDKKGILAKANWASSKEIATNRKLALKQIQKQTHNEIGLWIGSPNGLKLQTNGDKKFLYIPEDPKSVYLSNVQESVLVIAGPGSGKSASIMDRAAESAVWQGKSILLFDAKGHEEGEDSLAPSSKIAGFALARGYQVFTIAPGCPASDCLSLVDCLEHENDSDNAFQIGDTLVKNFGLAEGGNGFFEQTGAMLCQALMMLAKGVPGGDIALCSKFLALPKLVERLAATNMSEYQRAAFDNFLSSAGSPETAASIATTAMTMFSRFMSPDILSVFSRPTTIPLQLHGRQLLIFRVNVKKKALVMPLVAAAIDMILRRSIFTTRKNSLISLFDEFAMMKLVDLDEFLNTGRSSGSGCILATQSIGFAEGTYGEKKFKAILGGCGTQIIGRLNENQTAEYYEKQLGKEDLTYHQRSKSTGKSGDSSSSSEQKQTRQLMEIQEWTQLQVGEFVILNPGQKNKERARLPYKVRIKIPARDRQEAKRSTDTWKNFKAEKVRHRVAHPFTESELKNRRLSAESVLPLPMPLDVIESELVMKY